MTHTCWAADTLQANEGFMYMCEQHSRTALHVVYLVIFQMFQKVCKINLLQLSRQKHILLLQLVCSLQPFICLYNTIGSQVQNGVTPPACVCKLSQAAEHCGSCMCQNIGVHLAPIQSVVPSVSVCASQRVDTSI